MSAAAKCNRRWTMSGVLLLLAALHWCGPRLASAETAYKRIPAQYIAALGEPGATTGNSAETWGLWAVDPGPRGVRLSGYESLSANGGVAPASWTFDNANWWLEEHGLIMEQPVFPMPAGKYVVTGGREATAVLTVSAKDADGHQNWVISDGATLHDVTHLRCRSAKYTPAAGANSCTPAKAATASFPVAPGGPMPAVAGCNKQDYQVLIVIGMVE